MNEPKVLVGRIFSPRFVQLAQRIGGRPHPPVEWQPLVPALVLLDVLLALVAPNEEADILGMIGEYDVSDAIRTRALTDMISRTATLSNHSAW